MIQSFLKRLSAISFLLLFLLFLNCFIFLLFSISDNHTSFQTEEDPSFLPSLFKTGYYFRVAHESISSREETLLLLRCLFPSDSLLNFWRYKEPNKPEIKPEVLSANLKIFLPTEEKLALSAQAENSLIIDRDFALLSDDLEFRRLTKPSGKLIINSEYPRYCFPVSWPFFFKDGFGDPRAGNRLHIGIDIFAEEGTEVYAITDGVIQRLTTGESAGNTILLRGQDGKGYIYMHLQGYAAGINEGMPVKKGELIAYVGHTGTKSSSPHLHFQVHTDQSFSKDCALNPYEALVSLCQGRGVTDMGSPKPHFSQARELNLKIYSSESSRQGHFYVVKRSTSSKSTLIESWDGESSFSQEPGLAWRVPNPTWKVPRANFKIPVDKSEIPSSPTRVTWTWPKRKPSTNFLSP